MSQFWQVNFSRKLCILFKFLKFIISVTLFSLFLKPLLCLYCLLVPLFFFLSLSVSSEVCLYNEQAFDFTDFFLSIYFLIYYFQLLSISFLCSFCLLFSTFSKFSGTWILIFSVFFPKISVS